MKYIMCILFLCLFGCTSTATKVPFGERRPGTEYSFDRAGTVDRVTQGMNARSM